MNDTLKVAMGAELGAAKAENEKLRGLLTTAWRLRPDQHYHEDHLQAEQKAWEVETAEVLNAADALSQQPEPTETYTAVDMATAAAQGFRDGQAAVEQATEQDERKTFEAWAKTQGDKWLIVGGLQWSAGTDDYASARTNAAWAAWQERAALSTRPAQTEQQPVAVPEGWKLVPVQPTAEMLAAVTTSTFEPLRQEAMKMAREDYQAMLYAAPIAQTEQQPVAVPESWWQLIHDTLRNYRMGTLDDGYGDGYPLIDAMTADGQPVSSGIEECTYLADAIWNALRAAPIAQTAPQGKFRMGDLVKKSTGSEWVGRVVGWYSTEQTQEGYAVESEAHAGSVQIYPAKALEAVE